MAFLFVADEWYKVDGFNRAARGGSRFTVNTEINNERFQFRFVWNTKYLYYYVDVLRADGTLLTRLYANNHANHLLRGVFANPERPDMILAITSAEDVSGDPSPNTMGEDHFILAVVGRRVPL